MLSILYSTLMLGISPMPSSAKAYHAMMTLVDETGTGTIIDLGSGWGNFVIQIAKQHPHRQVIGYELSLLPWFTSIVMKKILGLKNLSVYRENFYHTKLPVASVLVCYLYPEAMEKIKAKLLLEKPKIDFLISNNFALPAWPSQPLDKTIKINDFYQSPIYLYHINTER